MKSIKMKTKSILYLFSLLFIFISCKKDNENDNTEDCTSADKVYSFTYNGTSYDIVKITKTWKDAASCAVERGGYLAEINDEAENTALFNELANAGISNSSTVASDGGGASYVWIGGNDMASEGSWIWDGKNDHSGIQFWQGDSNGAPVGGLYNNWGNEPDDYENKQDALGLAITKWPLSLGNLGSPGQWNDVNEDNKLFFIVEH